MQRASIIMSRISRSKVRRGDISSSDRSYGRALEWNEEGEVQKGYAHIYTTSPPALSWVDQVTIIPTRVGYEAVPFCLIIL